MSRGGAGRLAREQFQETCFELLGASDPPGVVGERLNELRFHRSHGFVVVVEALGEGIVFGKILGSADHDLTGNPVAFGLEGVRFHDSRIAEGEKGQTTEGAERC